MRLAFLTLIFTISLSYAAPVCDGVKKVVAKEFDIPVSKVCDTCSFVGDFGADKSVLVELFLSLEDAFNIPLFTKQDELKTVSAVRDYILSYTKPVFVNQAKSQKQIDKLVSDTRICTRIRKIISQKLGIPFEYACYSCSFSDDLGANESEIKDIFHDVEKEFDIVLPTDSSKLFTVDDFCKYVKINLVSVVVKKAKPHKQVNKQAIDDYTCYRVKKIVSEKLDVPIDLLNENWDYKKDLQATEEELDELFKAFEEEFDVTIPSEDRDNMMTAQKTCNWLEDHGKPGFVKQVNKQTVKQVVSATCDRVKRVIAKEFDIPLGKICDKCSYEDNFGVEPLQVVKLFEALQEEFKIKVPKENVGGFMIVEKTCQWFESHVDMMAQEELR